MQNIMFVYRMICPPGLQAEGLFYRNPGPPVSHSGGLLEDGVGVEVPFNRYAHRTQREGAGKSEGIPTIPFFFFLHSIISFSCLHLIVLYLFSLHIENIKNRL